MIDVNGTQRRNGDIKCHSRGQDKSLIQTSSKPISLQFRSYRDLKVTLFADNIVVASF